MNSRRFLISEISNIILTIIMPILIMSLMRDFLIDRTEVELLLNIVAFALFMIQLSFLFYISASIHLISIRKIIKHFKKESNICQQEL